MKKYYSIIIMVLAGALCAVSCKKADTSDDDYVIKTFKVVAHRGGYKESGAPECCIQGLFYSSRIGCYASECDIVPTADEYALVCHPGDGNKINGFLPYEKTLAEIRAAGKLANQENIPIMEDFVAWLTDKTKNPNGMKIWIDTKAWTNLDLTINAINYAYRAIKEADAYEFCEFIIPQNAELFAKVKETEMFKDKKCNVGFMASDVSGLKILPPTSFENKMWLQTKYTAIYASAAPYKIEDYGQAGVAVSTWCTSDKDSEMKYVVTPGLEHYDKDYFKALFVNYPLNAIKALKKAGFEGK